jgi:hypothetical protein
MNLDDRDILRAAGVATAPSDEVLDRAFTVLCEVMGDGHERAHPEGDRPDSQGSPSTARRFRQRMVPLACGISVAAVAILLLVGLVPSVTQKSPVAAAAQLRLIANNAAEQPATQLSPGQWLESQIQVSSTYQVTAVGSAPVNAEAQIPGTMTLWSNNFGESCTSMVLGSAVFASSADQAAWNSIGLSDTPTARANAVCVAVAGANVVNGEAGGVVNVSGLAIDPATLAKELQDGTTGIDAIVGPE